MLPEFIIMGILAAMSYLSVGIAALLYNRITLTLSKPLRILILLLWLTLAYAIIFTILNATIGF
jgi:hypothetical protein